MFPLLAALSFALLKERTSFRSLLCTSRAYFRSRSRGSPSIMRRAYFSLRVQFRRRRNGNSGAKGRAMQRGKEDTGRGDDIVMQQ